MKITLANLSEATQQQVFDQIVNHLLTQKRRSNLFTGSPTSGCVYRSDNGLSCAAGCLISDSEMEVVKEKYLNMASWNSLVVEKVAPSAHFDFITILQSVHDQTDPDGWEAKLRRIAKKEDLEFNWSPA